MSDAFLFFSLSKDAPPGRGRGERLTSSVKYALPREFRKTLSNFSLCAIEHNGWKYDSVEHAFHAAKLLQCGPEDTRVALAWRFTQGARLGQLGPDGSAGAFVGLDGASVKRAGGKAGVCRLTREQCAAWDTLRPGVLRDLWRWKFTHNAAARAVLLGTQDAELWHHMPRSRPERWTDLEAIRRELRSMPDSAGSCEGTGAAATGAAACEEGTLGAAATPDASQAGQKRRRGVEN